MAILVGLHHITAYRYDRPVALGPQIVRLRPAPHCRTRIESYSLKVLPSNHFINWQQDPHGNWLARFVFPEKTQEFKDRGRPDRGTRGRQSLRFLRRALRGGISLRLRRRSEDRTRRLSRARFRWGEPVGLRRRGRGAEARPHDRFPGRAQRRPAAHASATSSAWSPACRSRTRRWPCAPARAAIRPGCWCRSCAGSASPRVSSPAISSSSRPTSTRSRDRRGRSKDFTDLHAWAEVYIPGAGWIGMDATSGLFCGEGHLPLCATPHYRSAAPITGMVEPAQVEFPAST